MLVILGLLVGGVLTGQSLIRAAELRSVTTEFQKYQAAVNTFRDKYFALPGDMTNATQFWGAAHATPATCYTTVGTGTQTCNGNGDGLLLSLDGGTTYSEYFRAPQHLANAGLIEGNFSGVSGSGFPYNAMVGINTPRSKMPNTGFSFTGLSATVLPADTNFFEGTYRNMLYFGSNMLASGFPGTVLKPEEQWNIDTKMDDGRPAYGNVRAAKASSTCHTSTTPSTSEYALTTNNVSCFIIFILGI